jgi:diacylglycerol kinase (ATP)
MKAGKAGLVRLIDATRHSLRGLAAAFRHEAAFRQELLLAAMLLAASFYVQTSVMEWLILVLPLLVLLIVELVNSAIETTVDRIGNERNELSGRAKDMGSAAVFVCLLLVAVVWCMVLWSHFSTAA